MTEGLRHFDTNAGEPIPRPFRVTVSGANLGEVMSSEVQVGENAALGKRELDKADGFSSRLVMGDDSEIFVRLKPTEVLEAVSLQHLVTWCTQVEPPEVRICHLVSNFRHRVLRALGKALPMDRRFAVADSWSNATCKRKMRDNARTLQDLLRERCDFGGACDSRYIGERGGVFVA